jgi:hypothetical protein
MANVRRIITLNVAPDSLCGESNGVQELLIVLSICVHDFSKLSLARLLSISSWETFLQEVVPFGDEGIPFLRFKVPGG